MMSVDDVAVTSADDVAVMTSPKADVARGTWRVTARGAHGGAWRIDVHEIYTIKYLHIYIFSLTFMLFCD